jgi:predicted HicB family RNase H-like nuclease
MVREVDKYTYRVMWSEEDQEFVGLCAEFSGLSWLAGNPQDALKGVRIVVRKCIEDMVSAGEHVPDPISARRYSGKFMVRVPPEVHRHLAVEAAESGISLNRVVSAKLAQ